jgi:hypothetical protein
LQAPHADWEFLRSLLFHPHHARLDHVDQMDGKYSWHVYTEARWIPFPSNFFPLPGLIEVKSHTVSTRLGAVINPVGV